MAAVGYELSIDEYEQDFQEYYVNQWRRWEDVEFGGCLQEQPPPTHELLPPPTTFYDEWLNEVDEHGEPLPRRRTMQQVATVTERQRCVKWMIDEANRAGQTNLATKAMRRFPAIFSGNYNADVVKANRWWLSRDIILADNAPKLATRCQNGVTRRFERKCRPGRGRKRSEWAEWLHHELLDEFCRLSKAGVHFTTSILSTLAVHILNQSESLFNARDLDPCDQKSLQSKITARFIQTFCERFDIVVKTACGRGLFSNKKETYIRQSVAHHLGQLQRDFDDGLLHPDEMQNMDETHLVLDMQSPRCLGFRGGDPVKLTELVQGDLQDLLQFEERLGGESITMVLRISGGRHGRIHSPFLIFCNRARSYPIKGLPDDIPGVTYRSQPKGWMDKRMFTEWLSEDKAIQGSGSHITHLFLDNCSSHVPDRAAEEVLEKKNIQLHFLPKNSTDLCQPLDSFVIKSIKDCWRRHWHQKKADLIRNNCFSDDTGTNRGWSGKLLNPGKRFFLELAAAVVFEVNSELDQNGMNMAQKSMIQCGLGVNKAGEWSISMLSPHLQEIISTYPSQFHGEPPHIPE